MDWFQLRFVIIVNILMQNASVTSMVSGYVPQFPADINLNLSKDILKIKISCNIPYTIRPICTISVLKYF